MNRCLMPLCTYVSPAPMPKSVTVHERRPQSNNGKFIKVAHALSGQLVMPFSNNLCNLVSGLKERVFYIDAYGTAKPDYTAEDTEELMVEARQLGETILPVNRRGMSISEYLSTRPSRTVELYRRAATRIKTGVYDVKGWAVTALFVKTEKTRHMYRYGAMGPVKEQVPRIINPRKPEYNILVGKRLYNIEHELVRGMQTMACQPTPVVAKGLTSSEKASVIVSNIRDGYVAVGLDASRFDQSIGEELLELEHEVYKTVLTYYFFLFLSFFTVMRQQT